MNIFQSVLIYMGIYLGGGDVGMAKHHLYCTQVSPVAEHMGGKGVPEHMG